MFSCNVHYDGPVEINHPDDTGNIGVEFVFKNGVRIHHRGGWGGQLTFKGTDGEIGSSGNKAGKKESPPNIHIPNYKGRGGIFGDFLHCVRTRQKPFRNIEVAHRTASMCHLGNISYWLKRSLKWDPVNEQIIGDPEAARWIDRTRREPWNV